MIEHRQAFGTLLERPVATPDETAERALPREQIVRQLPSLRERTRADNRDRYSRSPMLDSALEFRCECDRPDCRVRLPLEVERHRRWGDRFIVVPAHADADTIVGVADRFLVVEVNGTAPSPTFHRRREQRVVRQ